MVKNPLEGDLEGELGEVLCLIWDSAADVFYNLNSLSGDYQSG